MQLLGKRQSERQRVYIPAHCITQGGRKFLLSICDLSAEGCRVKVSGPLLKHGDKVLLKPQGLEPFKALVCWVAAGQAGLLMERPLYGPVLDHLVRNHAEA